MHIQMEQMHIIAVIQILLANALVNANSTWTIFEAMESFEGKSCNEADFLFTRLSTRSKLDCLLECVNQMNCKSVFQVQQTGECVGCGVRYDSSPTEIMNGSKYYEKQRCPFGWFGIAHSCYFITQEATSFDIGITECQSFNAHAVIMNDDIEHANIKTFINSKTFTNGEYALFTAFKNTTDGMWTPFGFTETLTFSDWLKGEPSYDATDNCLVYFLPMNLQWIDVPCNTALRMICEKEI